MPGEGKLETSEDLVQILTSVIFISSAQHAAANFNQYDQYGFPAVYPARLKGKPPSSKVYEAKMIHNCDDDDDDDNDCFSLKSIQHYLGYIRTILCYQFE